ncbi:polysaccharide deacetylase family protein [Microbacterium sp. cx-55]|uniref:polysaccharide deacetylase family protein n=1 Tax=Microbacterium sp. cx-55 TaxID=2875948 RepID=UPI001CBD9BC1|nr:polysaccharide deacetylase family protein [Microbacterium sp. cx-55]UGB35425.1 polysaccharide deacetylase family protein [Microbacterium sp. cx-55]
MFVAVLIPVVVVAAGVAATLTFLRGFTPASAAPYPAVTLSATPAPTPSATPLTAAQQLLRTAADPRACAVSFAGDGIAEAPQLQTEGALYAHLPIPRRDGAVFAGWYATPSDAASYSVGARINGADLVTCADHETTVHAAWKSPDDVAAENVGVPILMYHQFTTKPEGESGWLKANYTYIGDFESHIHYLAESGFYLPTWDELSAFIDGALYIPRLSAIVTDDDADSSWLELAAPIVQNYRVPTTSFVITSARTEPTPNMYVLQRSHTHDMHTAGENGQGRMVNWTVDQIAADMETSAAILGAKEVMAYPYGHYNDTAKEALRRAGFEMARTVEPGYVRAGTDKLALPTIRINYGMDLDDFRNLVG